MRAFWLDPQIAYENTRPYFHQCKVLLDLGLSDKAATIDLRQLSLLINDEIIQSQVIKMIVVMMAFKDNVA